MKKVFKFASRALATFVLVAGAVVLSLGVMTPRLAGAETFAVLANSMAPRYPMGTLAVVRPADQISVGDVITYQIAPNDPTVVTHRVVGISQTVKGEPRFATRGDSNNAADPALVKPEQIHGRLWYAIPFAGYLVLAVNDSREYFTLALAVSFGIYALWQVVRAFTEKPKAQRPELADTIAPTVETTVKAIVAPPLEETWVFLDPEPKLSPPVTVFLPTMTRAERRRLAEQATLNNPDYSLVS